MDFIQSFIETEIGLLPDDWDLKSIDEIKSKKKNSIAMGPFGSNITKDNFTSSGVPVIRGSNLCDFRFNEEDFVYVSEAKATELKASNAFPKDIVITHRGTLGQVGIIPEKPKYSRYVVSQSQMKLSCDESVVNPYFVYYFLKSNIGQHLLLRNKSQTGVPAIARPTSSLKEINIPLPPLEEQNYIVDLLKSLDDKIELNRQMNETLEAMAHAIFKSWFVDFDPVRAKAEGRDTGLPEEIAELFPDSFEETEMGEVPRGWEVSKLSNVCEYITSGGTPSTQIISYWNGGIPWLSSGETRNCFITRTEKSITDLGIENSSTRLVRARSTVIASAGQGHTRGQTSLLLLDSYINQSVVALAADHGQISDYYIFFNLSGRYEELRQISDSHSSRGSLTTKLLNDLDIIIPPLKLVSKFSQFTEIFVGLIHQNLLQSSALAELRDTLLPKLISGELRIKDAEQIIGNVPVE